MEGDWTPQQQDTISGLYTELAAKPFYSKIDTKKLNADVFPPSGIIPFEEAEGILRGVLHGNYKNYAVGHDEGHAASHGHSLEEKLGGHGGHSNDIGGKAAEAHGGGHHKTSSMPQWMKAAAAVAFLYILGAPYLI